MFVILGATGNTGRSTCETLLEAGEPVRAVGRNLERLADLGWSGAELAVADSLDPSALTKAFTGADAIYCMIGVDPTVVNYDAHYDAISEAIVVAILASGVSHVVNLSGIGSHLPGTTTRTMGGIDAGRRHEERLNTMSAVNIAHLRSGFFLENYLRDIPALKATGALRGALAKGQAIPMVSIRDIGAQAAKLMRRRDFSGHVALDLLGPEDLAPRDVARILGQAIGKSTLEYIEISIAEFSAELQTAGVGISSAEAIAGIYAGYNSGLLQPEVPRNAASTNPIGIHSFARTFADAFDATPQ